MKRRRIVGAIIFCGIIIFFISLGITSGPKSLLGDLRPAPDIKLKDLDGNKFRLSDHRGKVILVNFWAVWCPPCKLEIPHLIDLNNKYKDKGLVILGIAINSGNDEKIRKKAQEFGVNYPIINGDKNYYLRKSFPPIRAIPTSFIINKKGKFYNNYIGFSHRIALQLEEDIKTLLNQ